MTPVIRRNSEGYVYVYASQSLIDKEKRWTAQVEAHHAKEIDEINKNIERAAGTMAMGPLLKSQFFWEEMANGRCAECGKSPIQFEDATFASAAPL